MLRGKVLQGEMTEAEATSMLNGKSPFEAQGKVKKYPTPTVDDGDNSTLPASQVTRDNLPGALMRDGEASGGQLNPAWVEWLMGWPIGWTDLESLEMDRFQTWLRKHGRG